MTELDGILSNSSKIAISIKRQLDAIDEDNKKYAANYTQNSTKLKIRQNLYQTNVRKFGQVINEYNIATNQFQEDLQNRTRRQLKLLDNKLSDSDINKIVESGEAQTVIMRHLGLNEHLEDVVREIEYRYEEVKKK